MRTLFLSSALGVDFPSLTRVTAWMLMGMLFSDLGATPFTAGVTKKR